MTKEFRILKRKEGVWGAVRNLFSRQYEVKIAVNNVSFEIQKGEIIGYIGPNGAGKSTTIKMLVGILVPTDGCVEVGGLVPHEDRIQNAKRMGVVFGQRTQLWWDIPVSESLNLMKYMYQIPDAQFKASLDDFSDILDLKEFFNVPVRQLSLGQRMRSDLCAAFLHNPDVLYLDEPTIGLDVVVKNKIREFIKVVNQERGTTVMLTTHDMSEVEKLCSRVLTIDQGKIVYDGNLQNLKDLYGTEETMIVETENPTSSHGGLYRLGVSEVTQEDYRMFIKYDRKKVNATSIIGCIMANERVRDFVVKETEIEEVIRKMYLDQPALNGSERCKLS